MLDDGEELQSNLEGLLLVGLLHLLDSLSLLFTMFHVQVALDCIDSMCVDALDNSLFSINPEV